MSYDPPGKHVRNGIISVIFGALCITFLATILQGCRDEKSPQGKVARIDSLYREYQRDFPGASEITVEELIERMRTGKIILVDNREPHEQEVSMIPGAMTDEDFEREIENHRDANVVVYCTIGSRSGYYTEELRKQGINAFNLKGGVLAWAHAGKSFVDEQGNETKRAHVYGTKWNLLPEDYEAIW